MSKLAQALPYLQFASQMAGPVKEFVKALFRRSGGDPERAKVLLRPIIDQWADWDEQKARVQRELEDLRKEGK